MNEITLAAFVELMLRQSAAGLFVAFVYALLKGWIVIGDQHDDEVRQLQERYEAQLAELRRQNDALQVRCDRWERIALKSVNITEAVVGTAGARQEAS